MRSSRSRRMPGPRLTTQTSRSGKGLGRGHHRPAGPVLLAGRDAGHRPQGAPAPGAQLRFTDLDGHRFTAFATDARKGQLADLKLRHRRRVRCEDRILRQGHRAAEPAAEGVRPQPAVVRDRGPGLRAAGLDPAPRPGGGSPPGGAQAPAAAPVRRRGAPGPRRPPLAAPPRRTLALGRPHHHRGHPPAGHPFRLTSQNRHCDTEGATSPGPVEPPPTRRDSRAASNGPRPKNHHQTKGRATTSATRRSRLVDRGGRLHRLRLCRRCATPWPIKSSRIVPLSSSQPSRPAYRDRRESGWHD